jgi:predicted small secreted protein
MQKIIAMTTAGLFLLLAACNTMEGMGEDVQQGGEALSDSADEAG